MPYLAPPSSSTSGLPSSAPVDSPLLAAPQADASNHPFELLAPAGCFASLQAAIDSGANSIYFGLAQLNMRARSRRSFQLRDLAEIMGRCRSAGVSGYLTLNTLLYDHDLPLSHALLEEAARQKVDAVIAADMACVLHARQLGLEVHLSTQLSVSNYESFKFYAQFCDRIVLARELNLSLIRQIRQRSLADNLRGPSGRPIEIEAFAHGALCIAISGRCGMSLYTDNASANRGACAQNCRKQYKVVDPESGHELLVDNNYVLSPSDLCTIDFLDQILEAGVHTLKLEGRGRSPEYVATVTAAYRRALDAIQADAYTPELVASLYQELETVYHRGHSSGYYLGRKQGWSAAHGSKATRQKVQAGRVTHYYSKLGVAEITATAPIKSGQDFLIIGDTTGVLSGTLPELRLDDATTVAEVGKGQVFSIEVPAKARPNDAFYLHLPA